MSFNIINNTDVDLTSLIELAQDLLSYSQEKVGWRRPPTIMFDSDPENAENPLGKTAHYNPNTFEIVILVDKRHPKDILRSLAHELIHHFQGERGDFDKELDTGPGYAQKDSHLRDMEREAYETGNLCFRDWEDGRKELSESIYYTKPILGGGDMSHDKKPLKEWKNEEINFRLMKKFGLIKEDVDGGAEQLYHDETTAEKTNGCLEEDTDDEDGDDDEDAESTKDVQEEHPYGYEGRSAHKPSLNENMPKDKIQQIIQEEAKSLLNEQMRDWQYDPKERGIPEPGMSAEEAKARHEAFQRSWYGKLLKFAAKDFWRRAANVIPSISGQRTEGFGAVAPGEKVPERFERVWRPEAPPSKAWKTDGHTTVMPPMVKGGPWQTLPRQPGLSPTAIEAQKYLPTTPQEMWADAATLAAMFAPIPGVPKGLGAIPKATKATESALATRAFVYGDKEAMAALNQIKRAQLLKKMRTGRLGAMPSHIPGPVKGPHEPIIMLPKELRPMGPAPLTAPRRPPEPVFADALTAPPGVRPPFQADPLWVPGQKVVKPSPVLPPGWEPSMPINLLDPEVLAGARARVGAPKTKKLQIEHDRQLGSLTDIIERKLMKDWDKMGAVDRIRKYRSSMRPSSATVRAEAGRLAKTQLDTQGPAAPILTSPGVTKRAAQFLWNKLVKPPARVLRTGLRKWAEAPWVYRIGKKGGRLSVLPGGRRIYSPIPTLAGAAAATTFTAAAWSLLELETWLNDFADGDETKLDNRLAWMWDDSKQQWYSPHRGMIMDEYEQIVGYEVGQQAVFGSKAHPTLKDYNGNPYVYSSLMPPAPPTRKCLESDNMDCRRVYGPHNSRHMAMPENGYDVAFWRSINKPGYHTYTSPAGYIPKYIWEKMQRGESLTGEYVLSPMAAGKRDLMRFPSTKHLGTTEPKSPEIYGGPVTSTLYFTMDQEVQDPEDPNKTIIRTVEVPIEEVLKQCGPKDPKADGHKKECWKAIPPYRGTARWELISKIPGVGKSGDVTYNYHPYAVSRMGVTPSLNRWLPFVGKRPLFKHRFFRMFGPLLGGKREVPKGEYTPEDYFGLGKSDIPLMERRQYFGMATIYDIPVFDKDDNLVAIEYDPYTDPPRTKEDYVKRLYTVMARKQGITDPQNKIDLANGYKWTYENKYKVDQERKGKKVIPYVQFLLRILANSQPEVDAETNTVILHKGAPIDKDFLKYDPNVHGREVTGITPGKDLGPRRKIKWQLLKEDGTPDGRVKEGWANPEDLEDIQTDKSEVCYYGPNKDGVYTLKKFDCISRKSGVGGGTPESRGPSRPRLPKRPPSPKALRKPAPKRDDYKRSWEE